MSDLALIILNYNTKELLKRCLGSIFSYKWKYKIEVWVVDNDSKDDSVKMVKKEFPEVNLIISDTNKGFAGGNNLALRKAAAKNYLLLNSDTEVTENSLDNLISSMEKNNFDMITCKLVNPDGSLQPNAGDLPTGTALYNWLFGVDDLPFLKNRVKSFHRTSPDFFKGEKITGWISGTAMLFKNEVLKKTGLLDEKIFMYCEDIDYCMRAKRLGFVIGWTDRATIMHIGGGSSANPKLRQWLGEFKELLYLQEKYKGELSALSLKAIIYLAILMRTLAFFSLGKFNYAKTYLEILKKL